MCILTYMYVYILIPSGGHIRKSGRRYVQEHGRWYRWMYIYMCSRSLKIAQCRSGSFRVDQA